jgi:hypothetical protein
MSFKNSNIIRNKSTLIVVGMNKLFVLHSLSFAYNTTHKLGGGWTFCVTRIMPLSNRGCGHYNPLVNGTVHEYHFVVVALAPRNI